MTLLTDWLPPATHHVLIMVTLLLLTGLLVLGAVWLSGPEPRTGAERYEFTLWPRRTPRK